MSGRAIDRYRPPASKSQSDQEHLPKADQEEAGSHAEQPLPRTSSVHGGKEADADKVLIREVLAEFDAKSQPLEKSESEKVQLPVPSGRSRQRQIMEKATSQFARGARIIGAPLVWIGVAAFCGGTGFAAFSWLFSIPPVPDCDRVWFFTPSSDKLYCAEQAVRSGNEEALISGLKLVEELSSSNQLLQKNASFLQKEWSKALLQRSHEKATQDDLEGAIKLAKELQPNSPSYRDAKNLVLELEKVQTREKELWKNIEPALKAKDWSAAETALQNFPQSGEYQQRMFNRLKERIVMERMAHNQLQQLRELVKAASPNDAETLGRAVQLAMQIRPNSYVQVEAQEDIRRWSTSLVELAEKSLRQGNVEAAIAVSQWLPATAPLTPEVRDLVWFNQARQAIQKNDTNTAIREQLWQLTMLLSAISRIQSTSPIYAQVQGLVPLLERRVQDLNQLALASFVASTQQPQTLQLAEKIAQMVTLERPYRIQAQTLIADWRKDIQRVQDRPYLSYARQLAASGSVADFQAAIAQAAQIPLGRALRPEAQAAIFDWRQQIQVIEDKPILIQARKLAQQQKLPAAIQEATKIASGRALYKEAQTAIAQWTRTIQLAEDSPILEEANALASRGAVGAAINTAYQIAPGRVLYDEAQTAIAQWNAQLEATRRSRGYREDELGNRGDLTWQEPAGDRPDDSPRRRSEPDIPPSNPEPPPPPPELPPP